MVGGGEDGDGVLHQIARLRKRLGLRRAGGQLVDDHAAGGRQLGA